MKSTKLDGNHIKIENRKLVFSYIFRNPDTSRPEIVNSTGLSGASVGRITQELIDIGIIKEYDSPMRNVGRRPSLLSVCGENVPAIAFGLDRDKQVCAVVDMTGKVHYREEVEFFVHSHSPQDLCDLIKDMATKAMSRPEFAGKTFAGIGIALPGLVNHKTGTVMMSSQFRWRNIPSEDIHLKDMLQKEFPDIPICMDNDVNSRAFSEILYGDILNEQNVVVLGIGSGIGAGIIINGEVYRGDMNMSGEIGHIIMDPNGKMCDCGCYGCLETFIADWALIEDAQKYKRDANITDINDIITAAENDETWAISIINRYAVYVNIAISYFACLLNPSTIILSGYIPEDYPALTDKLLKENLSRVFGPFVPEFRIRKSRLGHDGAIIGAAAQLLYKKFNEYI